VFDRALVEAPLPAGEIELARHNDELVTAYLADLDHDGAVCRQVRHTVISLLGDGPPTTSAVATAMATSPRSLQRRLQDEGATFRDLLQEVRLDVARDRLRAGTDSVGEIADQLGFSDTTAFSRAFKRWTGVAPSCFR
jgi:AraC-like DNA-binding protein